MVHIAVIGLGTQTESDLLPAIEILHGVVEVEAICDISQERLKKFATIFPNAKSYIDYKTLLSQHQKMLDFIIVVVPHNAYNEIMRRAIAFNIPILKEKPLALNYVEAQKVYTFAKQNNVNIVTLMKRNFYPNYIEAKKYLPLLGKVYQYAGKHYVTGGNIHEGWKSRKDTAGGGVVINLGYHMLKIIIDFFGEIEKEYMFSSNHGNPNTTYEVEDAASMIFLHRNSIHGTFQINAYGGIKEESIEIIGTKGVMFVSKTNLTIVTPEKVKIVDEVFDFDTSKIMAQALDSYLTMTNKEKDDDTEKHLYIMQIIDKLYKSNREYV